MDPGEIPSGVRSYDRLLIANQEVGIKPACLAIEQLCCLITLIVFISVFQFPKKVYINSTIAVYVLIIQLFSLAVNPYFYFWVKKFLTTFLPN